MNKGSLTYVKGNVCEPQPLKTHLPYLFDEGEKEIAIIPHCCNDIGVMGAGVALALKKKWGAVEYYYQRMAQSYPNGHKDCLGKVSLANPDTETYNVIVANMIAQRGVVSADNPKPIKYAALVKCMEELVDLLGVIDLKDKKPVLHCPKFGSDLAGGKWEFIEELIKEIWVDAGYNVIIYEFEPDPEKWGWIPELDSDHKYGR